MNGTFGAFGVARLGIYAAQSGLDVTGNNITNINTEGYTRQRLDLVSLSCSASDKYASRYNIRIGQGVLTAGVVQLRDAGLDLQYRGASANVGSASQKLSGSKPASGRDAGADVGTGVGVGSTVGVGSGVGAETSGGASAAQAVRSSRARMRGTRRFMSPPCMSRRRTRSSTRRWSLAPHFRQS